MSVKTLFMIGLFSTLLLGCSGAYKSYEDMVKLALSSPADVQLSYQQVMDAPADYLYVKLGELPQVAMGLAFVEGTQFKWVSADKVVVVTEYGRIVRTSGLPDDLLYLTNTVSDPLKRPALLSESSSWLRLADWKQTEYGYQIRSSYKVLPTETLTFFGHKVAVTPVLELLRYENESNFVRFDGQWQNQFWLDSQTGEVLKSRQTLAPGKAPFDTTYISAIARKLKRAGIDVAAEAK